LTRAGKGHVKHQYGTSLHVDYTRRRLTELHRALAAQQLTPAFVDEANSDSVDPDLGAPAPNSEHQVGARIDRWEVRQPDVLEHAEHTELALLINQGIVSDNGKIEMQLS
jgi:hypothetical protein